MTVHSGCNDLSDNGPGVFLYVLGVIDDMTAFLIDTASWIGIEDA
jgi:hypothetical protein